MARRARISIPRIPWHIIQRCNNRSVCFYANEDYQFYLDHLCCRFAVKTDPGFALLIDPLNKLVLIYINALPE